VFHEVIATNTQQGHLLRIPPCMKNLHSIARRFNTPQKMQCYHR